MGHPVRAEARPPAFGLRQRKPSLTTAQALKDVARAERGKLDQFSRQAFLARCSRQFAGRAIKRPMKDRYRSVPIHSAPTSRRVAQKFRIVAPVPNDLSSLAQSR